MTIHKKNQIHLLLLLSMIELKCFASKNKHKICKNNSLFPFQDGYFNQDQVSILDRKVLGLLEDIRPNAVALVDAFDYPDHLLQSCLGRYDGQVYEALYEYSKSSPQNNTDVRFY